MDNQYTTFAACDEYLKQRGFEPLADMQRFKFVRTAAGAASMQLGLRGWSPKGINVALAFPYFKKDGITETGYLGVRWIGNVPEGDGKFLVTKGRTNEVYFPARGDWDQIPEGAEVQIHESILKCLAATKAGAWAVAINGCYGWSSGGRSKSKLALNFEWLPWAAKQLVPVLVLDSNGTQGLPETKPEVVEARARFTFAFQSHFGVEVRHKYIPPHPAGDGSNWGFDDWRLAAAPGEIDAWLREGGQRFELDENVAILTELDEMFVIVQEEGKIYERVEPYLGYTKDTLANVSYNHIQCRVLTNAGPRSVPAINVWTARAESPRVRRVEYLPGVASGVCAEGQYLNIWRGMGVQPLDGDCGPILEHLHNVLPDDEVEYLLDVMAYPLQNLGRKVHVCPVLEGAPGVGKSVMLELLYRIYGDDNYTAIDNEQMQDKWSEFLHKVQFVGYEEARGGPGSRIGSGAGEVMQKLKKLVTDPRITIKQRNMDDRRVPNRLNIWITTNYIDALRLDPGDRRFSIHRLKPRVVWTRAQWSELHGWAERGNGPAYLYGMLLGRNIAAFDPYAPAMHTPGKVDMEEAGLDPREYFIATHKDQLPAVGRALDYEMAFQKSTNQNYIASSYQAHSMLKTLMNQRIDKVGRFKVGGRPTETYWNVSGLPYYNQREQATEYLKKDPWKDYNNMSASAIELKLIKGGKQGVQDEQNDVKSEKGAE